MITVIARELRLANQNWTSLENRCLSVSDHVHSLGSRTPKSQYYEWKYNHEFIRDRMSAKWRYKDSALKFH